MVSVNIETISHFLSSGKVPSFQSRELGEEHPLIRHGILKYKGLSARVECPICTCMVEYDATIGLALCEACGTPSRINNNEGAKLFEFKEKALVSFLAFQITRKAPTDRGHNVWNLGALSKRTIYYARELTKEAYMVIKGGAKAIIIVGSASYDENEEWKGGIIPLYHVLSIENNNLKVDRQYLCDFPIGEEEDKATPRDTESIIRVAWEEFSAIAMQYLHLKKKTFKKEFGVKPLLLFRNYLIKREKLNLAEVTVYAYVKKFRSLKNTSAATAARFWNSLNNLNLIIKLNPNELTETLQTLEFSPAAYSAFQETLDEERNLYNEITSNSSRRNACDNINSDDSDY